MTYRFGNAELVPSSRQLLIDGVPVALGSRAFDVLAALIENRDRVVTKHELLDLAWPGLVVEENNLAAQVSALRKVLGSSAISTIPGIGYRFSAAIEDDEATPAPMPGISKPAHNLPHPTESLVGRDADLSAVAALLDEHRLVTVVGAGGVGKTRLAQDLARSRHARFAQGAWWVDLATLDDERLVAPAIAYATALPLAGGDSAEGLARAIGNRAMLLVLDNCEHVAEHTAGLVQSLLGACPALRVLATSQERLRVPGEYAYALEGLAAPGGALQLLERRAQAVDRRYRLADKEVPLAIELCRRLDGIPLAIEMAAARIPLMGLEALVRKLGERLDLLRSPDRGAPARYRTLRSTLDWSYSLLSPVQKEVLERLSIFVGSFGLDAASAVAAAGELDEWGTLDALSALVEKSLLRVETVDPPRYRLLETLRLFGLEHLQASGKYEAAVRGHAAAMAAVASQALLDFDRRLEVECVRRYAPYYDDLRVVWDRGCERDDPEMASCAIMAVARLDIARGFYQPVWFDKARALAMVPRATALSQARLWYCIALMRHSGGVKNVEAARSHVEAWRRVGDKRYLHDALGDLAEFLAASGNVAEAEGALAEMRMLQDPEWDAQVRLGYHWPATMTAALSGDMELFGARLEDQEHAAFEAGSFRMAVVSSWQRVAWAVGKGDLAQAQERGIVAVRRAEEFGNPSAIAAAQGSYCSALLLSGQQAGVSERLQKCLGNFDQAPFRGYVFDALALLAARVGDLEGAASLSGFADACYTEGPRGPLERRVESEVRKQLDSALDPGHVRGLVSAGKTWTRPDALAFARKLLGNGAG